VLQLWQVRRQFLQTQMLVAITQLLLMSELADYYFQIRSQALDQSDLRLPIAWVALGVTRSIACREPTRHASTL
jgi:hypothetical protein